MVVMNQDRYAFYDVNSVFIRAHKTTADIYGVWIIEGFNSSNGEDTFVLGQYKSKDFAEEIFNSMFESIWNGEYYIMPD